MIVYIVHLCLTSTYFQYNGKHYKQLHGTAMGSPVSVVVAEIVIQHVEEHTLATCWQTILLWLHYLDDTFTAVHKEGSDDFHDQLNKLNADIQFTEEIEENGKLPFSRLCGRPNACRQITRRIILQPNFTQSHDYKDFHKMSTTSLWHMG